MCSALQHLVECFRPAAAMANQQKKEEEEEKTAVGKAVEKMWKTVQDEWKKVKEFVKMLVKEMRACVVLAVVVVAIAGTEEGDDVKMLLLKILKYSYMMKLAVLPLQLWNWLGYMQYYYLGGILQKCNYMERRLMNMQCNDGDICRQVQADMVEYDEDKKGTPRWMCRRLRKHYGEWMKATGAGPVAGRLQDGVNPLWSWVCTEVQLRYCRDVIAARWTCMEKKSEMSEKTKAEHERVLKNMQMEAIEFWMPLTTDEWREMEAMQPGQFMEKTLQSQLVERMQELQKYADDARNDMKEPGVKLQKLLAGMPNLAASFMQSSGSASEAVEPKKKM